MRGNLFAVLLVSIVGAACAPEEVVTSVGGEENQGPAGRL